MSKLDIRLKTLGCGALWLLAVTSAVRADDTEIFFGHTSVSAPANIMLVLDTSGSMAAHLSTQRPYDPTNSYSGTCSSSYYYFADNPDSGAATPPSCSDSSARIASSEFRCNAAATALGSSASATGYYIDQQGGLIRWGDYTSTSSTVDPSYTTRATCEAAGGRWSAWRNRCTITVTNETRMWQPSLTVNDGTDVECGADQPGVGADAEYPSKNSDAASSSGVYSASSADSWWRFGANTPGGEYVVYSANYLNYLESEPAVESTRWEEVRGASVDLLQQLSGVNVGLMTYSYGGSGGMVRNPVLDIDDSGVSAALVDEINSMVPAGDTPLSETLFEAYRYFSGGAVLFGGDGSDDTFSSRHCTSGSSSYQDWFGNYVGSCDDSEDYPSAAAAQQPAGTYDSPADYSCQKNYIIYLTDGEPTNDNEADVYMEGGSESHQISAGSRTECEAQGGVWRTSWRGNTCTVTTTASGLPNFDTVTGGCDDSMDSGRCLEALSKYLYASDLRTDVANTDGAQNVKSYFIGFGDDFQGVDNTSFALLQRAAAAGGGAAYTATDRTSLAGVFADIGHDIAVDQNTSFSAPTVAVNAFNRTQTLDDLYVSVFVPQTRMHWPGNVKKYRVVDGVVVDADGHEAVDAATGFFAAGTRSFWSAAADGPDVPAGGAASRLPDADERNVYTYVGSNTPGSAQALVDIDTAVTDANAATLLGLTGGDPTRANLMAWAQGEDIKGENPPTDTSGMRHAMGDPVHSEPAVVIYSDATSTRGYETVVFVTTNDGYLHAFNTTANVNGTDASDSGVELWSFIPQEMLRDLRLLYANDETGSAKHYGLDGPVRVLKYDVDGDGAVEPADNDRVVLFFTTGRNSSESRYYAIDVTDKDTPQFMWSLSSTELPGLGQAWSSPTVARITVDGATQNGQHLVLVFGGGYDAVEDSYSFVNADSVGNHVYMVDAKSGALLWSAGPTSSYTFEHARMTHAISSPVTVLDVDNDGFADRLYVGDMAGQLWRFDIANGEEAVTLVTGGVIASLGTKEDLTHTMANTRRFYAAPDVALVEPVGARAYYNVAIGSGYRSHPLNTETNDRLYGIRDYYPRTRLTQAQYDAAHLILDDELEDITEELAPVLDESEYGWKLNLTAETGVAGSGEKVVSSARTLNNIIYFTTYTPAESAVADPDDPCATAPGTGVNRVYAISVFNGAPVKDRNDDGEITLEDRSSELKQGGIAPGISLLFPGESGSDRDVLVMSGPETVDTCIGCRALRKTYWYDGSAE
jgi:type IV pilus assembly protein PilY1